MIAPALAPATFTHFLIGLVGCSANPSSAPARPSPLTPPPRKTPSASSIQSMKAILLRFDVGLLRRGRPAPLEARDLAEQIEPEGRAEGERERGHEQAHHLPDAVPEAVRRGRVRPAEWKVQLLHLADTRGR